MKSRQIICAILISTFSFAHPLSVSFARAISFQTQITPVGILGFEDESGTGAPPALRGKLTQYLRSHIVTTYKDALPRLLNTNGASLTEMSIEQMASIGKQNGVRFVVRGGILTLLAENEKILVQLYADVVSVETSTTSTIRAEGTGSLSASQAIEWNSIDFNDSRSRRSAAGQALSTAIERLAASIHQAITLPVSQSTASAMPDPVETDSVEMEPTASADEELQQLIAQAESLGSTESVGDQESLDRINQALKHLKSGIEAKARLMEQGENTAQADQVISESKEELQAALSVVTEQTSSTIDPMAEGESDEKKSLLAKIGQYAGETLGVLQRIQEMRAALDQNQEVYDTGTVDQTSSPVEEPTIDLSGVITEAGSPVEGARVEEPLSGISALTDKNGAYNLTGLIGGRLANLTVTKTGKQHSGKVNLPRAGSTVADFDMKSSLSNKPAMRITPSVVALRKSSASSGALKGQVRDHQGKPVALALVNLNGLAMARTDFAGRYSFLNVPPGSHLLTVRKSGLNLKSQQVQVAARKTIETQTQFSSADRVSSSTARESILIPKTGATVRGVVLDEQKRPLAGVKVIASLAGKALSVTTKSNGTYELGNLRPGQYRLLVSRAGYQSSQQIAALRAGEVLSRNFQINKISPALAGLRRPGSQPRLIEKSPSDAQSKKPVIGTGPASQIRRGGLRGQVIDARTGRPLAGAIVSISGRQNLTTSREGLFSVVGLPAGSYRIIIRRSGYGEASGTVAVRAGGIVSANFRLIPRLKSPLRPRSSRP